MSSDIIPEQISLYPKIKLCGPNCSISSHGDCESPGKRPLNRDWQKSGSSRSQLELQRHLDSVGNYGVVTTTMNDLVVIDADDSSFAETVENTLQDTFTVETHSGYHYYYKSDWNENKRWNNSVNGEIKAEKSQVVGPGSTHPSGEKYTVDLDYELVKISDSDIQTLIRRLNEKNQSVDSVESSGSAAAARSPHSTSVPDSLSFIRKDSLRQKVAGILHENNPGHNDRCWLAGWLYAAAGLRQSEIVELIVDECRWGDLDEDIVERQVAEVIEHSRNSRGTHYSEYTTDDVRSASGSNRGQSLAKERKSMPSEWNTSVTEKNGTVVCRAGIEHIDPDKSDMESWDEVSLLFGKLETDTEFGEFPDFESNQYGDQNTHGIGSTRSASELRAAAAALEKLADQKQSQQSSD